MLTFIIDLLTTLMTSETAGHFELQIDGHKSTSWRIPDQCEGPEGPTAVQ